jgi:hypothetical protein
MRILGEPYNLAFITYEQDTKVTDRGTLRGTICHNRVIPNSAILPRNILHRFHDPHFNFKLFADGRCFESTFNISPNV